MNEKGESIIFYDNVKYLAARRGMSMPELGEKIGVGRTNIYKWKTQTPAVETISKVAIFFGVSIERLIGDNVDTAWAIAAGTIDIEFLLNNYSTLKYGEKTLTADDVKRMRIILDAVFFR